MRRLLNTLFAVAILFAVNSSLSLADDADIDRELSRYVSVINGEDFEAAKRTMETLRWSGISDSRVYDPIADKLESIKLSTDGKDKKKAAWYAKALGFSGDEKHRSLLESVVSGDSLKNVQKYARIGLKHLDNYRTWNEIISKGTAAAPAGKLDEIRISNMLRADNPELVRLGAKRVSNSFKGNETLITVAAERLSQDWSSLDENSGIRIDTVAWLLKGVGTSRSSVHTPLVEKIKAQTKLKKIRKYAKIALKKMNA